MDRKEEIKEKVDRLLGMMAEDGLGGVLLNAQHNFSWLTAGGTSGIDTSREPGAGTLLVRADGRCFVLANRIEIGRLLGEELPEGLFEPVDFAWEAEKERPSLVLERAVELCGGTEVGSDLPLGSGARAVEGSIARCRYQLTTSEIERLRSLGADAGAAIEGMVRGLEPGETELEVARRATDALARVGARSVVTLAAADERLSWFRHPVPTARAWNKLLMVVVCARRGGLIVSLTRIVCAGPLQGELERRTLANARVNARLLEATRPGATGAEIYNVAARAYAEEGFEGEERLHHQGGATGYRTREWVAHPASQEVVRERQAFAWNPSITGTKVEETCIAYKEGVEIITSTPGWPQLPVQLNGREYLSPGVLAL